MRTINGAELFEASDAELEALVKGEHEQTWETRQAAQSELDRREIERLQAVRS